MAGRKSKEGKPPPKNGAMWRNVALIGATLGLASAARRITRRAQMFDGRVVVITGGSRGLGLELARAFAGTGARVAICARTSADLARAAEEFNSRGCSILARVCDVPRCGGLREIHRSCRGAIRPDRRARQQCGNYPGGAAVVHDARRFRAGDGHALLGTVQSD